MCKIHISLCEECGSTRVTSRTSCGTHVCYIPETIYEGPQLCSTHARTLVRRNPQYPEHSTPVCESTRLRSERNLARNEMEAIQRTLHDVQDTLDRTRNELTESRNTIERVEKSRDHAISSVDQVMRFTTARLNEARSSFASEKSKLEAGISQAKNETAAAAKAASEAEENLKKKDEELQAVKKSLSGAKEDLKVSVKKDVLKKELKKHMRKAIFGGF